MPDDERRWPLAQRKAFDRELDAELAAILSKTEISVAGFVEKCRLSQSEGQALLDLLRHPQFDVSELHSRNIVQLIRRLERPMQESTVRTYNMWKEGDGNQRLELVVRDYLEVFREIMRNPQWKNQFDLVARPIFDETGERLIGPACSALQWERIQAKLPPGAAVGAAQAYFDETFMGDSQGMNMGYLTSLNLKQNAHFQTGSVKLFALLPTYDANAADKTKSAEDIKWRTMELLHSCIAIFVRQMNKYSSVGGEVNILCPDNKVYTMLVIMMSIAMDHKATEQHCLKAANGCLSCDCPADMFDDCSEQYFAPMLTENVIEKIEKAAALYLNADGSIKQGMKHLVDVWETHNKIKLYWNSWFDVSRALFLLVADKYPTVTVIPLCSTASSESASRFIAAPSGVLCIWPPSGYLVSILSVQPSTWSAKPCATTSTSRGIPRTEISNTSSASQCLRVCGSGLALG